MKQCFYAVATSVATATAAAATSSSAAIAATAAIAPPAHAHTMSLLCFLAMSRNIRTVPSVRDQKSILKNFCSRGRSYTHVVQRLQIGSLPAFRTECQAAKVASRLFDGRPLHYPGRMRAMSNGQ